MNQMIKYATAMAVVFLLGACGKETAETGTAAASAEQAVAVDSDSANALFQQAMTVRDGDGAPANRAKALELFTKADQKGDVCAAFFIGVMYENGELGSVDLPKALEWLTKAEANGCQADPKRITALKAKMKK